jgi:hypothetical protein
LQYGTKTLLSAHGGGNAFPIRSLAAMDRIYLIIVCASIVLLTTVLGMASPPSSGDYHPHQRALLLRTIPR